MNIKLVRFPYKDYEVDDVVDLGPEKNRSMVALGRAVWEEPPKVEPKKEKVEATEEEVSKTDKTGKTETTESVEEGKEPKEILKKPKKKLIENKLKKEIAKKTDGKEKSFWDKLK